MAKTGRQLLRRTHAEGPGRGAFTRAETGAAPHTPERRITPGRRDESTSPAALNARAARAGPGEDRFVTCRPGPFPRTFSATDPVPCR